MWKDKNVSGGLSDIQNLWCVPSMSVKIQTGERRDACAAEEQLIVCLFVDISN